MFSFFKKRKSLKTQNDESKCENEKTINKNNDFSQNEWVSIYFEVLNKILDKYQLNNFLPYKDLRIKDYVKNYKISENSWKYQRHHVDEIFISGAELMLDKEKYNNGLSLIVSFEEHCFLHYLIVLSDLTNPNHGMLMQISLEQWDAIIRKQCYFFNVKYIEDWVKNLTI
ncbi:hypothetical protein NPA08_01105 [Mycoplasmopsis citelli]|uniref:hypothetical protein n=1 Tax=Mycoplasmopsis citelli TaxID=171281 RepID=UPI0021142B77|nr:hypothetical protein [Mycoplasmopsis citelli]UUD36420.1 hypothetical protein NPA08_01105 [Mycoplasmopsis citelli]